MQGGEAGSHKAVAVCVMFVVTLAFAMVPLYVRGKMKGRMHQPRTQAALSGILCFGAGVLLATVFLHLLPEARMFVEDAMSQGYMSHITYPLAELLVCLGFFVIYIVEEAVHACLIRRKKEEPRQVEMTEAMLSEKVHLNNKPEGLRSAKVGPADGHSHGVEAGMSLLRAIVVVVAFSFHSVMEGLALGLQHQVRGVWFLFAALMSHKVIVAFCMAMELLETGLARIPFIISMTIFSLSSPVGGLAGTLVMSYSNTENAAGVIIPTVLQGISAGTILYVTFCEVLERERAKEGGGGVRLACLILGFGFMAGLQVLDQEAELATAVEAVAFPNITEHALAASLQDFSNLTSLDPS